MNFKQFVLESTEQNINHLTQEVITNPQDFDTIGILADALEENGNYNLDVSILRKLKEPVFNTNTFEKSWRIHRNYYTLNYQELLDLFKKYHYANLKPQDGEFVGKNQELIVRVNVRFLNNTLPPFTYNLLGEICKKMHT